MFIGSGMDESAITVALDRALLEHEAATDLSDPFPALRMAFKAA